jgi:hypothetical protein
MNDQYRRLAVFIDHSGEENFLWVIIESTDDPAVWLDLETGDEPYGTWLEAFQAGNEALMAYIEDEAVGPVSSGPFNEDELDDE